MSRFEFRLATLLRLRESIRDEKRAHLAEAYHLERLLAERHADLGQRIVDTRRSRVVASGHVDVDRLLEAQRYEMALRFEQAQIEVQQVNVATEIERRRAVLVEADQQVRVLEKLRERQAEEWRAEEERRNVYVLDEVAGRQHRYQESIV